MTFQKWIKMTKELLYLSQRTKKYNIKIIKENFQRLQPLWTITYGPFLEPRISWTRLAPLGENQFMKNQSFMILSPLNRIGMNVFLIFFKQLLSLCWIVFWYNILHLSKILKVFLVKLTSFY